jgi:hypothetical protein
VLITVAFPIGSKGHWSRIDGSSYSGNGKFLSMKNSAASLAYLIHRYFYFLCQWWKWKYEYFLMKLEMPLCSFSITCLWVGT